MFGIAHHSAIVGADVPVTDVISPQNQDFGLFVVCFFIIAIHPFLFKNLSTSFWF
jgi:hypothetical protein